MRHNARQKNQQKHMSESTSNQSKERRECGKGEAIRHGADIEKYVDNYDKIFRHTPPAKQKKIKALNFGAPAENFQVS